MPAEDWRIMPARSISRCETICASLGFSRISGKKYWERRMAPRLRSGRSLVPGPSRKHSPAKKARDRLRHFAYYRVISKTHRQLAWPEFREVLPAGIRVPAKKATKDSLAGPRALPSFCAEGGQNAAAGRCVLSINCFTRGGDYGAAGQLLRRRRT